MDSKPHQRIAKACIQALPDGAVSKDDLVHLIGKTTSQQVNPELWKDSVVLSGSSCLDWVANELLAELDARSIHANHIHQLVPNMPETPKDSEYTHAQRLIQWLIERAHAVPMATRSSMTFQQFILRETCFAVQPKAWYLRTHDRSRSKSDWLASYMTNLLQEDSDAPCLLGWAAAVAPHTRQPRMLAEIANYLVDAPAAAIKI
jgi:hypothetical protein